MYCINFSLKQLFVVPIFQIKYLNHTYARGPSFFQIFWKQSRVFLYLLASSPCILVFTTSIGVFPKTETAPANPPNMPGDHNSNLEIYSGIQPDMSCLGKISYIFPTLTNLNSLSTTFVYQS